MKNIMSRSLFILMTIVLLSCQSARLIGQRPGKPQLFALNIKALEKNKTAINNKDESVADAYKQLIKDADKALKFGPVSVMEKTHTPPSGDKHDYMSLAPYHWPDSSKPGGLPYMRKDGQTNPEVKEYKDKDYQPKLCEYVQTLALAYYFSESEMYAEHAAKLLRVWFLDPETRMNPNLNFAQAIKGVNEGRGAGLIDTRHYVKLIDGINLLKGSKNWKAADQAGMQQWFASFLNWMQTSEIGIHELNAKNNHGAWYDAQRLALALFVDSTDLAKRIISNAAGRLDYQVDENGFFPKEMERTISLHYTAFVMNAFFTIAQMADKVGIDFWKLTTPSGKSLQKTFVALKPYLADEKNWEGQQIKAYDYEDGYMLMMEGYNHFKCRDCEQAVQRLADEKASRLRIKLLY
ncbi:MAG: alginate lyase family protein [Ferruginibacter sp.]